jgi:hypothetical protein
MNLEIFRASTNNNKPPKVPSTTLGTMRCQEKGDWEEDHRLVQTQNSPSVSWVHAHLHRVEGDPSAIQVWMINGKKLWWS